MGIVCLMYEEKSSSTIQFFKRSDYYTCHGEDALFVSNEVFKTTSSCKMIGAEPNKLESVLVNKANFENLIKDLLLVRRYRVEVYEDKGTGRNRNWVVEYKGSPGNLSQFEEILFDSGDIEADVIASGAIMAVIMGMEGKSKVVGLSCIDTMSSVIRVAQFMDDEAFSNLEALTVSNSPKECLLIQSENSQDFETIKGIIERNNVMITLKKKKDFDKESLIQDLDKLLKFKKGEMESAHIYPETNLEHAMSATAGIIKYLDLLSDEGNLGQYKIEDLKQYHFLKLDSAAIRALNIDPPPEYRLGGNRGAATSIHELLDKCKTPQGHRLLSLWLKQPLQDLAHIKERHDIVEYFVNNSSVRSEVSNEYLRQIPDLEQLVKKLLRKKARLRDVYKIYDCVNRLPQLVESLSDDSTPAALKSMILEPLKENVADMEKYQQMVEETIDFDAVETGEYFIKPSYSSDLTELNESIEKLKKKMKSQLSKAAEDLGLEAEKSIKLECTSQQGYFFRVTMKEEKIVSRSKSYTVFDSIKSGVKFRNGTLEALNQEYLEDREKYEAEQKIIVTEVINLAIGYCSTIKNIAAVAAVLDVLCAFAVAATNTQKTYVRPKMLPSDAGEMKFIQARHPCVEGQEDVHYIANDIEFKRGESEFHIITGPNMGGKSTHLKTAGIVVLLAHIGSFVPCDEASMSMVDCIFARVGAEDSPFKGLSTFMAEMIEMAYIMRTATSNSLILIDELGRGTSTYDGRGLAWAIAEDLAKNVRAFTFFATHFHEITILAENIPTVKNYHVTALVKGEDVVFLYAVKEGVSDQSFGINVARMVNLPPEVIEYAEKKLTDLEENQHIYEGYFEGPYSAAEKRKFVVEADALIEEFTGKCKALDPSLPEDELMKKINEYKEEIVGQKNPYIEALLKKSKPSIS
ncbi:DNA mismatch repair protein Msh2 isoform X2 [Cotesia glomerata]|uniref:DNA mismatch repair protein Msh2 isoform X2 n=1 Tax=Cotesia glomerata TaxID=32391 RepID=UPI001D017E51|nr:DNA mismatch repair protein Msh2 isoform X2 [Cotesia glomerata]